MKLITTKLKKKSKKKNSEIKRIRIELEKIIYDKL